MEDWSRVPVFGEHRGFPASVIRESAYVLASREDRCLASVRTSQGTFLPGGGIEGRETPWQAIVREASEECGLVIHPGAWVGSSIQLVYSDSEQTHFEKRSIFCDGMVVGFDPTNSEPDHELLWILPEEAPRILSHESQQWAVKEWLGRQPETK